MQWRFYLSYLMELTVDNQKKTPLVVQRIIVDNIRSDGRVRIMVKMVDSRFKIPCLCAECQFLPDRYLLEFYWYVSVLLSELLICLLLILQTPLPPTHLCYLRLHNVIVRVWLILSCFLFFNQTMSLILFSVYFLVLHCAKFYAYFSRRTMCGQGNFPDTKEL